METTPKKSCRLLLVDDDSNLLYLVRHYFEFNGFEVITAINALEGKTILAQVELDLIICDVMMPGMSGHTFVRQIKSDPATQHIPVIFLSAKSKLSEQREGFECGADSYVVKPFEPEKLVAAVNTLLKQQQSSMAHQTVKYQTMLH
jgi:DNA-binding response OmpR family regulator